MNMEANTGKDVRSAIAQALDFRELYRYLGYRGTQPDEAVRCLAAEVAEELTAAIEPRYLYKVFDCRIENDRITLYNEGTRETALAVRSQGLAGNLERCEKAALIAATLGLEADKLLGRYEVLNMAKASVAQACGAACIEAYCNLLQEDIGRRAARQGFWLRPRFSPGYGDLDLETQRDIFRVLECTKRIGLTLTESLLMYPTKSVTAFIGWTTDAQGCPIGRCGACGNMGCEFRDE
ncbi:MAG: Vitamin B12 dependent methionine synthase activation subunit [Roseburia sp.]|nr:Vitamin B12 dependent methionine synthase activation subunit [Roseburia sp.]